MILTKTLPVIVLLQLYFQPITFGQTPPKYFRSDYKYLSDNENFYKIHTVRESWHYAKEKCELEGASLFYPEDEEEADEVLKYWNETQTFSRFFVGISSLYTKGAFVTLNGDPVTNVYNKWMPGEPNNEDGVEDCVVLQSDGRFNDVSCSSKFPFICKKKQNSVEWDQKCNMPRIDYNYNETLQQCYKLHLTPKTWNEAYATCFAEQSYLAVINSQAEADYFIKITKQAPKQKLAENFISGVVYLGYRKLKGQSWKSIKGETLEESGYNTWGNKKPDADDNDACATMFFNGLLNDVSCNFKCYFICEYDTNRLDFKFGE